MIENKRILLVDVNRDIHDDFRKVLCAAAGADRGDLDDLELGLFGSVDSPIPAPGAHLRYEVDSAYQGEQALDMVRTAQAEGRPYAMAFMDVRMPPGWDGIQTIARIWIEFPYTEIVICTAFSDYSWEDIIAKLGSTDHLLFLTKPFDSTSVKQMALTLTKKWSLGEEARSYVARLERDVKDRTFQLEGLLEEVKKKNLELEYVSLHDSLTDLPNRALFSDRLQYSANCAARDNQKFGVLVLDLDRFKEVNDVRGHRVGDLVLCEVARRLLGVLRDSDTVARMGGDEFAVILHNVDKEACMHVAKKIGHAMEPAIMIEQTSIAIGASVGIAMYPDHGENEVDLLKSADVAMYDAKRAGTGFSVFDSEENTRRTNRLKLIADLDDAINYRGLSLHYQPIIDLKTNQVRGVEALCRWIHPAHGFIPPDDFIALAEQKGLIQALTLWVLDTALAQCAAWHVQGLQISMAVNLSARNFLDPELPHKVENYLKKWQVPAQWLCLEITESMTMTDPARALEIIRTIDAMGVKISIDDFGTGYSSLAYLKKLQVDELKIDRSFVLVMDKDPDNQIIVRSTIDLAHSLGMSVVAEGIETESVMKMLASYGCDKVQGYYLCKPKPAEDVTRWLQESQWGLGTGDAVARRVLLAVPGE